ncbi:hypothetical protein [Amycolatopsis sp. NPDC051061]|uniref:hypothetical protein n=1 Tax=Amycolatopsis sp. NPDC051061 TaxID=3155042 RepID=UPI00341B699B
MLAQDLAESFPAEQVAITGTGDPDAEAMMIVARRTRIDSCLPRRVIRSSVRTSSSVNRRALNRLGHRRSSRSTATSSSSVRSTQLSV